MEDVDSKISANNSTVVPTEVRDFYGVRPGDRLLWEFDREKGAYVIRKLKTIIVKRRNKE